VDPVTRSPDEPPGSPLAGLGRYGVGPRNAAVYGAYSAVVVAVQVVLFVLLDETRLPAAAPLCLLVLPAMAWLAGFLTIGFLFPIPPGESPKRTPRLGIAVCLVPNALLLAAVVFLFALNTVG
jgi:hypothetical protein